MAISMNKINKVTGLNAVVDNLDKVVKNLTYQISNNIAREAKDVLDKAQIKCPKVTTNLMHSGYVVWKTPKTVRSFYGGRMIPPPEKKNGMEIAQNLTRFREEKINEVKTMMFASKAYGAVIGFASPYALFVHEWYRSGKTGGTNESGTRKYKEGTYATEGEYKFLENAIKESVAGMLIRLSRVTVLGKVIRESPDEIDFSTKSLIASAKATVSKKSVNKVTSSKDKVSARSPLRKNRRTFR